MLADLNDARLHYRQEAVSLKYIDDKIEKQFVKELTGSIKRKS
jgi:hypothetical protein